MTRRDFGSRRDGSGEGFRQQPVNREVRKLTQEAQKHITYGEFVKHLQQHGQVVQTAFQQHGRVLNDASVRIDALQKTLIDRGLITYEEVRFNQQNLRIVQQFVVNELGNDQIPFRERVHKAVDFNKIQPPEFQVTDSYFPVRQWLVENEDGAPATEIVAVAESFGMTREQIVKVFIEERLYAYARRMSKVAA